MLALCWRALRENQLLKNLLHQSRRGRFDTARSQLLSKLLRQVFVDALSVVSCVVLKSVMKRDYNLSPEQCATFNPREIRQERIGRSMAMFNRDKEDGQTGPGSVVRNRFPAADWLEKVWPLVERFSQPADVAAYIRELTDADPWDDSRTRHEHKIDALEGRRGRRAPKASPKAKVRGQAKKDKKKGRRWEIVTFVTLVCQFNSFDAAGVAMLLMKTPTTRPLRTV